MRRTILGSLADALNLAAARRRVFSGTAEEERSGFTAWLIARLRRRDVKQPRLALVERISIAPRQVIALIEADGQRVLVATAAEGAPTFYPLKPSAMRSSSKRPRPGEGRGEGL